MSIFEPKIILQDKSFILDNQTELVDFCSGVFRLLDLNYFNYVRYYYSGEVVSATTHPKYMQIYYGEGTYVTFMEIEQALKQFASGVRLKSLYTRELSITNTLPTKTKHWANMENGRLFGVDQRISFATKKFKYMEFIELGGKRKENFALFCLENLHIMENFIDYFKTEGNRFIAQAEKYKIKMPNHLKAAIQEAVTTVNYFDFESGKKITLSLSSREYECLENLYLGKSCKEIGNCLQLSTRTVETYVERLKAKTGVTARSSLASFFRNLKQ